MRIIYVARHDAGLNRDEDSIAYALAELGHVVHKVNEKDTGTLTRMAPKYNGDLLLFHKWSRTDLIQQFKMPKVFWYFDLVDIPDNREFPIRRRCQHRINWMKAITPLVDLGFCTDGDWVNQDTTEKLHWLPQGADIRVAARAIPDSPGKPILFTGIGKGGGLQRESFTQEIQSTYGNHKFEWITRNCYRERLREKIANTQIVLAPDFPVTDNYWSNRVYISLGFGAYMAHPYCKRLATHYQSEEEIHYYHTREELLDLIDAALLQDTKPEREEIQQRALERTISEHTYTHRCQELIETLLATGAIV